MGPGSGNLRERHHSDSFHVGEFCVISWCFLPFAVLPFFTTLCHFLLWFVKSVIGAIDPHCPTPVCITFPISLGTATAAVYFHIFGSLVPTVDDSKIMPFNVI